MTRILERLGVQIGENLQPMSSSMTKRGLNRALLGHFRPQTNRELRRQRLGREEEQRTNEGDTYVPGGL